MSSKPFTSSNGNQAENGLFTFGEKMRVLRKLRELEFGALDRHASPEGAVLMVYRRALEFYDSQWPNDEGGFRDTLLRMQERRMRSALKSKKS